MNGIKFLDVVFMQGDDATEVIDLIEEIGEHAALEHLTEWDFGVETEFRAHVAGQIYDELTKHPGDWTYSHGEHVMTYNTRRGYVALYRVIRNGDTA